MSDSRIGRRSLFALSGLALLGAGLAGCAAAAAPTAGVSAASTAARAPAFLAANQLHSVDISVAKADLTTMVQKFLADGTKEWLAVTVTIDGTTHEGAGIRLKGNSSLKGVTSDSKPEELPWLVRLDKFADGASHEGMTDFIIRSNSSETALNEAVALDLLAAVGLASEQAAYLAFAVNGSDAQLRLAVENLDDAWVGRNFAADGVLYKADASGDYSWRGTDPASYTDVFDVEAGDDDLAPLIAFLDFVNNADDAAFAAQLGERLDVPAFTTYLAFEALVDNFDDIDGPGNNSFLWWAEQPDEMTVVAWDHNLAFGLRPGGAGRPGDTPPGGEGRPAGQGGGPGGKSNPLVTRFTQLLDGAAKVSAEQARLKAELYTSGRAATSLDTWAALLTSKAAELVATDTVTTEKATIAAYFTK